MIGVKRRLARLFDQESGRALILPMDHGASDGMLPGLAEIPAIVRGLAGRRVQGVVLNKGMARAVALELPLGTGLVVQLSAGTRHALPSYNKSVVCSVGEALRLGADAVCMHLNIGNDLEDRMLADLGALTDEAHLLGLPVMAVLYAVGGQIVQELDPSLVAHCIRLGGELGVDLIGVPYSGDAESFGAAAAASPAPVVIVGGQSRPDFDSFLGMAAEALDAGAAGVAVGRNIFQNPDPLARLDQLAALVHSAGPSGEDREEPQPGPDPAEARQDA